MNDPIGIAARAAAQQLQAEAGPGLAAEVEAVLATRESPSAPPQYIDPIALASLIVAIASLAWTVYTDLKKRTAQPSAEVVARTVRVTRRDQGQADAPDPSSRSSSPRPSAPQPLKSMQKADQNSDESAADVSVGVQAVASVTVPMQTFLPESLRTAILRCGRSRNCTGLSG